MIGFRNVALFLLCSLHAWAQDPQLAPVPADHLKGDRFLFEWGSIENQPGTSWCLELDTPSDRWHYAAMKMDRQHADRSRMCHLYVFPPEPLDEKRAEEWFKLLMPEASPPEFKKSDIPLHPSFWSPIHFSDGDGSMVLTATPQALYCREEIGASKTPQEFGRWLRSFRPTAQKQHFEAREMSLSGALEVHDGVIRVAAGQFKPLEGTTWIEAKVPANQLELYHGTRMRGETVDVFAWAVEPDSHQLRPTFVENMVDGMASSTGQKRTSFQVDETGSDRLLASFQLGDVKGYAEDRLTSAGQAIFVGFGPGVTRSEVDQLAASFQPSAEKIEQSVDDAKARVDKAGFQFSICVCLFFSGFISSASKTRSAAWSKFFQVVIVAFSLVVGISIALLSNRFIERLFTDVGERDHARGFLLGVAFALTCMGPAAIWLVRRRRRKSGLP